MSAILISVLAFSGILGATLLGMRLRAALPDHQLSAETKDSVRLGMGLVVTMTALLLGLLVASAKGSYDNQRSQVIQMTAKVAYLDRALAIYGPETAESRRLLREATGDMVHKLWPDTRDEENQVDGSISTAQALYSSIHKLTPQNDEQRALKSQALDTVADLGKSRALLSAQADTSIATPLLVVVVVWLAIIFLSFGLFAPMNKTVIVAMIIVALSVSSALFLILELDRPFDGLIQISSTRMRNALGNLGK